MVVQVKQQYSVETYQQFMNALGFNSQGKDNLIKLKDDIALITVNDFICYWCDFEGNNILSADLSPVLRKPFDQFLGSGGYWDILEYALENMIDIEVVWFYKQDIGKDEVTMEILVLDDRRAK